MMHFDSNGGCRCVVRGLLSLNIHHVASPPQDSAYTYDGVWQSNSNCISNSHSPLFATASLVTLIAAFTCRPFKGHTPFSTITIISGNMAGQNMDLSRPPGILDSDYDQTLTKHVQHIRKNGTRDLPVDPSQDTIAYLAGLLPHSNRDNVPDEILIALAGFLTSYDPVQARYAGREWRTCILWTAQIIQKTGDVRTRACRKQIKSNNHRHNCFKQCVLLSFAWILQAPHTLRITSSSCTSALR